MAGRQEKGGRVPLCRQAMMSQNTTVCIVSWETPLSDSRCIARLLPEKSGNGRAVNVSQATVYDGCEGISTYARANHVTVM